MSEERFAILIRDFAEHLKIEPPIVSEGELLLKYWGRTFQVSMALERAEITFSTVVFPGDYGAVFIFNELIADFNARHIFRGGYQLSVDPITFSLYLSVTKTLGRIEASGLSPFLDDFIRRCASYTRWYAGEIYRRLPDEPPEEARMPW